MLNRRGGALLAILALALQPLVHAAAPSSSKPNSTPKQRPRACEESGMCSVGSSSVWVGDIKSSSNFQQMLKAVAFKKEIMVIVFDDSSIPLGSWEDLMFQLHYELMDMGFAHHIMLTLSKQACDKIARPTLSCAWDSSDWANWIANNVQTLTSGRLKLMTRAARLGYNVMSVDTDSMLFRDPYVHLKSPIFKHFQFLCNPEAASPFACNSGWMYVQNARPDGPVTWFIMESVRGLLRRADDHFKFQSQWTHHDGNCIEFDQALISDALATAAVGRPLQENAVRACKHGARFILRNGNNISLDTVMRNMGHVMSPQIHGTTMKIEPDPVWLANRVGIKDIPDIDKQTATCNLTVPNLNYGWPEELGGRLFPDGPPGQFSGAFMQMLKEDCPSCPWWPEERPVNYDPLPQLFTEDFAEIVPINSSNSNLFIDPSITPELMGHTPRWLAASLTFVRRGMFKGRDAEQQGYLSVGHVHVWHLQISPTHKTMIRKVLGRYNWTAGEEVARSYKHQSPYLFGRKVTRVLALSPKVDLSRTRSWEELSSIITGLVQVAWLSHRVLVLPELPCETAWLHRREVLAEAQINQTVCLTPMFWRHPDDYPLPLTIPVDERGELVGSWARRHLRWDRSQDQGKEELYAKPLLLAPEWDASGRQHSHRRQLAKDSVRSKTKAPVGAFASGWNNHHFVAAMPQFWDTPCTQGLHGIIGPEFFHWLKHTDEGRHAKFTPSTDNTVLLADTKESRLSLQPALGSGPGSSWADVPAGEVVPPSDTPGWSWYDVQAAVPSGDVVREMRRVASEPLVYVEHPVMVVPSPDGDQEPDLKGSAPEDAKSSTVHEAASTSQARRVHQHAGHDEADLSGSKHRLSPNAMLQRVNDHLANSKCKALWTKPDTKNGQLVNLAHGLPARIDGTLKLE